MIEVGCIARRFGGGWGVLEVVGVIAGCVSVKLLEVWRLGVVVKLGGCWSRALKKRKGGGEEYKTVARGVRSSYCAV